jgi:hypothetical protein
MMSTGTDTPTQPPQARRRWGWPATATALTVAVLVAAGVTVWIGLRGPGGTQTARFSDVTHRAPSRLVVNLDSGGLTVRPGPAGQVSEKRVLTWTARQPTVTQSFAGGTLTITSHCPPGQLTCGTNVTLSVPPGVAVQAHLGSSDAVVSGLRGPVSLTAGNGDLRVSQLSGPLQLRSGSGDIIGESLASTQVGAQATAGDVSLGFTAVPARVSATSDAGDVNIDVPRAGGYQVRAATSAGDRAVSVQQDPASTHAIIATSDAGDVTVAYSQP